MGKPIRLPVCNLSRDFRAISVMPTESWNRTPVQRSHDSDVILHNLHTSGAKKLLESCQTLFELVQ